MSLRDLKVKNLMNLNSTNPFILSIIVGLMVFCPNLGKGATVIRAQIFSLPKQVETGAITTAAHYILASHLVRSLTKVDKFGRIQPDVAVSWKSKDKTTWTIDIGKEKFSNGDPITAADVLQSIQRQQKLGSGVHFSFSEISSIKVLKEYTIEIVLKNPSNDFVFDLGKPEFGILHKSDQNAKKNELKLSITSGAYFLHSKTNTAFYLKRNLNFNADVNNNLDLSIESADGEKSFIELKSGSIHFFTTQQNLTNEKHRLLIETKGIKAIKPHVAFSYWLSINPNCQLFKNKTSRHQFQSFVDDFKSDELNGAFWEKSNQIYLPDGDGRPKISELELTWNSIKNSNHKSTAKKVQLRVVPLKTTNRMLDELLLYLGKRFDIKMISYQSEDELINILKSNNFDLKISANDFSSIDLSENLKTSFNSSRPYIFLNKESPIPALLSAAIQSDDRLIRSENFRNIGLTLLRDGLIAPIAYQRAWFYSLEKIDINAWSTNFPEISFWKVHVHD
jgi:hypothetical protein